MAKKEETRRAGGRGSQQAKIQPGGLRPPYPPVLNAEQAAQLLHLPSARRVHELAKEGKIRVCDSLGKTHLFVAQDLIEAVKKAYR